MYVLMIPFILSHTILTRNVKGSKRNLSKPWGLKPGNFVNVPKNIYIYLRKKHLLKKKHIYFDKVYVDYIFI